MSGVSKKSLSNDSFKKSLYASILENPLRLLSIVFILGSIIVWYSVSTIFLKNLITAHYGIDSGDVVDRITAIPTETLVIAIPFWILIRIQDKTMWLITLIFAFFNTLIYIINPQAFFKWVGYKQTK